MSGGGLIDICRIQGDKEIITEYLQISKPLRLFWIYRTLPFTLIKIKNQRFFNEF